MKRHLPLMLALSLAGCSAAPSSPAEAIALAGRSGPELTAASAALDAGAVLTATAAVDRCADDVCRGRVLVDALEAYRATAEGLRWATAAQRAAAHPGEPLAVGPDVAGVLTRLGFAPKQDDPELWCNQFICIADPGGGTYGGGGPAPAPGNNPPPPPVPKP